MRVLEGSHLFKKEKKKEKGRVNAESQVGSGGGWGMTGGVVHSEGYSETSPRKKKKKEPTPIWRPAPVFFFFFFSFLAFTPVCWP